MKSMTGFGRGAVKGEDFAISVELKTVNNRFLDVHMRANPEAAPLEGNVRRRLVERLSRGRIDVQVSLDRTGHVAYELNRPLIAGFVDAMRAMRDEFSLSGEPDVNVLARLPGVMQPVRNQEGLSDEIVAGLESALDQAILELETMRSREGAVLASEMRARLAAIERSISIVEAQAAYQIEIYRARLQKRISELMARDGLSVFELDQGRLAQEVAYLAERSDISEELARLRSHVEQFRKAVDNEGDTGKRLDFLLQEFNREANTVLSKSTDASVKEAALLIKGEVEKLREQVQNVE